MGQRSVSRKGWGGSSGGGSGPISILRDLPTGLLALSGDLVVPQTPAWSGATFFTVAGLFNNTAIIQNNGSGVMQVNQDGLYMLYAYGTNKNTQITSTLNVRFTQNGVVIPNSEHQIYEHNTDSDRDMICKGVPVVLSAGDLIKCEFNSSDTATTLMGDATWIMQLSTGVQGDTGPAGPAAMTTDEFSVFRSTEPTNQDITPGRNIFWNETNSPNDVQGTIGTNRISIQGSGSPAFDVNCTVGSIVWINDGTTWGQYYTVSNIVDADNIDTVETITATFGNAQWRSYVIPAKVTELYDVGGKFDISRGTWTPAAGKYNVSACGGFDLVGDEDWSYILLFNLTQGIPVANGGRGRNEGNGQFNSVLSCQITANGTDEYGIWCISNDNLITIKGVDQYKTYFMASKITDTP